MAKYFLADIIIHTEDIACTLSHVPVSSLDLERKQLSYSTTNIFFFLSVLLFFFQTKTDPRPLRTCLQNKRQTAPLLNAFAALRGGSTLPGSGKLSFKPKWIRQNRNLNLPLPLNSWLFPKAATFSALPVTFKLLLIYEPQSIFS